MPNYIMSEQFNKDATENVCKIQVISLADDLGFRVIHICSSIVLADKGILKSFSCWQKALEWMFKSKEDIEQRGNVKFRSKMLHDRSAK